MDAAYTAAERTKLVTAERHRRYKHMKYLGVPTGPVPAVAAAAHIRRLYDLGWSYDALAAMTGDAVSNQALRLISIGETTVTQRKTSAAVLSIPWTLAPTSNVPASCKIPALGTTRRVQALMRMGWTHAEMKRRSGGVDTTHVVTGTYRQTVVRKWRDLSDLYDELSMTTGPSTITATDARNRRFQPPLAWWEIDDPDEVPQIGRGQVPGAAVDRNVVARLLNSERIPSTKAEKEEAMRRWLARGNSARSLALMHGWQEGRYVTRGEGAA